MSAGKISIKQVMFISEGAVNMELNLILVKNKNKTKQNKKKSEK